LLSLLSLLSLKSFVKAGGRGGPGTGRSGRHPGDPRRRAGHAHELEEAHGSETTSASITYKSDCRGRDRLLRCIVSRS